MNDPRDILILGGGIAGLSTAYFLAREGDCRVTLLEKEESLGQHSTGKNAAILRTWTPDPELTRYAVESVAFLQSPPPGFASVPLIDPRGLVLITQHSEAECRTVYEKCSVTAPRIEALSRKRFRELAPHFGALPDGVHALYFPDEGHLDVAAITDGFARGARAAGARIETSQEVRELDVHEGVLRGVVLANGKRRGADTVVLAAGGWAGRLAQGTGSRVSLTPTRRHLCVTDHDERVASCWPTVWSDDAGFYTRPESGGMLLCACDQTQVDPDHCEVDPTVLESLAEKTAECLPAFANAPAAHLWAGIRTHADNGRFVIGPDDDVPGLFWVAGLGGHGMTSSAAVGRRAARLLLGQALEALPR